ncbi:D-lactate dehydrogenase VanH-A [Acidiferrimicrobium sp. IK]|nr:NAD(P)-dependent oxidoreductase [Acidiferrimicrobium sp. IK]MCU4186789.1 D-lactate dehydrogenase VanH-A [Acidiferrimicrobium sp. IK]
MAKLGLTVYGCGPNEATLFGQIAPRLGVVPTLVEAAVSDVNLDRLSGTRCISVDHKSQITKSILVALGEAGVKYICTRSVGCNHVDVESAQRVGITVENVVYSADSVADYTLMLMLMLIRKTKSTMRRVEDNDYRLNDTPGRELRDMTVGVIGVGRIGSAVMGRLRGFGCRLLAYDRGPKTDADYVPLDVLLEQSDVVTLHTPLEAGTHHLLNRHRIEQMKRGAFIINTGRGGLLDTVALLRALESGRLGGAALDVLEGEQGIFYSDQRHKPVENRLLLRLQQLPNVLITPHTAYYTDHALADIVENTLLNCRRFESRTPWRG